MEEAGVVVRVPNWWSARRPRLIPRIRLPKNHVLIAERPDEAALLDLVGVR